MHRRRFLQSAVAAGMLAVGAGASGRDRNPRLLVVDSVGCSLEVFDPRTFSRETKVALEKRPREVALSADGSVAYVSIYGPGVYGQNPMPGHEVAAIDLASLRLTKRIDIRPHSAPHGMAVAPDGRLWVTCEAEGELLLIDPAAKSRGRSEVAAVPLGVKGPHWIALTPDGSKLYAANKNNPVLSVVDARDRRLVQEIKVPRGIEGIAIAPDGRRLFAADLVRASLWLIDTKSDRPLREFPLEEPGGRLLATPDDRGLMVSHYESGTIEVFDLPTLRKRGSVRVGRSPSGMAASSDGRTGYVASWVDGTVSVVDLMSLRVMRTIEVGGGPDGLALVG